MKIVIMETHISYGNRLEYYVVGLDFPAETAVLSAHSLREINITRDEIYSLKSGNWSKYQTILKRWFNKGMPCSTEMLVDRLKVSQLIKFINKEI